MHQDRISQLARGKQTAAHLTIGLVVVLAAVSVSSSRWPRDTTEERIILDYPPRIIHQPPSVLATANSPQTIECPVDAKPTAEIKWFKDNRLLAVQAAHLDQSGADLMFVQIQDEDSGDYHCQATNYMGTIRSDSFRLDVNSSVHEPLIRMEPELAEVGVDQRVDFTCSIPVEQAASQAPDVSWRRNGQKLKVKWLDEGDEQISDTRFKFVARQLTQVGAEQPDAEPEAPGKPVAPTSHLRFVLSVTRTNLKDDNSTFSCLYKSDQLQKSGAADKNPNLARESSPARLRVYELSLEPPASQQPPSPNPNNPLDANNNMKQGVKLDINLGPPINDLGLTGNNPREITGHELYAANSDSNHNNDSTGNINNYGLTNNQTTQLMDPTSGTNPNGGLANNNGDRTTAAAGALLTQIMNLFELIKPALVFLGLLSVVGILVLLQLMYSRVGRQKLAQSRYIKHHHYLTSSASGSSTAGSSSAGSCAGGQATGLGTSMGVRISKDDQHCDPMLSSLMARALSAPSASSLKGASKKFRSYRDHMRKVSALPREDSADGTTGALFGFGPIAHHDNEPFLGPNLYNQSLAAREQARSLLQSAAGNHMRSLSNLNQAKLTPSGTVQAGQNGSHLNLPMSFAFEASSHEASNRKQNFAWLPRPGGGQLSDQQRQRNQHINLINQQQQQQQHEEHYQLVNCSSVSPSSSSSSAATLANQQTFVNLAGSLHLDVDDKDISGCKKGAVQGNHYSIIEAKDEEECRYEELESNNELANEQQLRRDRATDSRAPHQNQSNQYEGFRASSFLPANQYNSYSQHNTRDNGVRDGNVIDDFHRTSTRSTKPGPKASLKPSLTTSGSEHTNLGNKGAPDSFNKEDSTRRTDGLPSRANKRLNQSQDQLSPYAVSSICGSMVQSQQQPPPPPPTSSEAMKALSEQFDFN